MSEIKIDVDAAGMLNIVAEKVEQLDRDDEQGGITYHRTERTSGRQWRKLALPQYVDTSKISAKLDNGVLTITAPKKEGAQQQQRRIAIS